MSYFAQNLQMISRSSRDSTCPVGLPGLINVRARISSPSLSTAAVLLSSSSRSVIAQPFSSSKQKCILQYEVTNRCVVSQKWEPKVKESSINTCFTYPGSNRLA